MRRWVCCGLLMLLSATGCVRESGENARLSPKTVFTFTQLALYKDAQESFQAALALKPGDPDLLYDVGQCCDRLGQDAAAERAYSDCIQRSPNHAECRHALATLLVRHGRWSEATTMVHDWLHASRRRRRPSPKMRGYGAVTATCPKAQTRVEEALALDPHDNRALEDAQINETDAASGPSGVSV